MPPMGRVQLTIIISSNLSIELVHQRQVPQKYTVNLSFACVGPIRKLMRKKDILSSPACIWHPGWSESAYLSLNHQIKEGSERIM